MPKSWLVRGAEAAVRVRPATTRNWKPWEVSILKSSYPDVRKIAAELPNRTRQAIRSKAAYIGIAGKSGPRWTDAEIIRLRKVYPTGTRQEVLTAFPGRTYIAVAHKARLRKIHRSKKANASTGIRLLDQILKEAERLNFSRSDLDYFGRSGRYFKDAKWKRQPDAAIHCRVAIAMGATIRAGFGND